MGNKISEVLDSMTAAELAALEGELDKRAGELAVQHYYNLGVEAARREFAIFKESGELTPILHLIKSAVESEKDEEENKKEDEKSEKKLPPWLKDKGKEKSEKDDEKDEDEKEEKSEKDEDEDEEKKEDEKNSSDLAKFIDKASAKELEEFEKALDSELLSLEYTAHYLDLGRKLAQEMTKSGARAPAGLFQSFTKSLPKGGFKTMMTGVGQFAKAHPVATGAAIGVGGTLVGQKLLGQPDRR